MIDQKVQQLIDSLKALGRVAVAFSGGVDSTFLAAAAKRALGDGVVLVTAFSASTSAEERQAAAEMANLLGLEHIILPGREMEVPEFIANCRERCYHCKRIRFGDLIEWAGNKGIDWIIEGTNADDLLDYRPGMRAVEELSHSVRSPLLAAGLTKAEIRRLSKDWGLPTWAKPSAACLVSRLEYGLEITPERLGQIEKAEAVVREHCEGQLRVRHHGKLARIEAEGDCIPALSSPDTARDIASRLKELGFSFVTLDMEGYRTGSLNCLVKEEQ